ncbi:MAG: tetratricopeptide repeat protein, partial [Promethearchaeia archaeon]
GVEGHLLKWNATTGRWGIKLSTGQELSVHPSNVMPTCSHAGCGQRVGATEAVEAGLQRCAKCRKVVYCSKKCQKAAWKGGHKQECKEGGTVTGRAPAQQALRAALLGQVTTRREPMDWQERAERAENVLCAMRDAFNAGMFREVVKMAEEGLQVAGELESAGPHLAEIPLKIYWMLGHSYSSGCEHVKGLKLLEQAKALAEEAGDPSFMALVRSSLGYYYQGQSEHAKAIAECEQARAIFVELGDREGEGVECVNLGRSYMSLQQYDKAIELFEQALAIHETLGDMSSQASTRKDLGRCLSRHGQHDMAVACLNQAYAVFLLLGDAVGQMRAAKYLGEALLAQVQAEHHQTAPDATSCGGISAASADTLQEAETWLRTALDLGEEGPAAAAAGVCSQK